MDFLDSIIKKRDGGILSKAELEAFSKGAADGSLPDYQLSAMLMAIYLRGLSDEEMTHLTLAMAESGERLDLSDIPGIKVDKHSTGGVADTATLVLAPLVAACGVPVVKMSGKGLGFSGGTVDKLSSIPGIRLEYTQKEAIERCKNTGIVLMSQSAELAPADKRLYALRDVTGTVPSLPLIAASIMSKKIAAGADAIVLDVKFGSGAFMKTEPEALSLAKKMVAIGKLSGRAVRALITDMNEPLGKYIGNALEIMEAAEVLKGNVKGRLLDVSLALGAQMLILAGICKEESEAEEMLMQKIASKEGLQKFREVIAAQGGDPRVLDDFSLLPRSECEREVKAPSSGYIFSMDTEKTGRAFLETGGGRRSKEDEIDYGAGIIMRVGIGDKVQKGDVLANILAKTDKMCAEAEKLLLESIVISEEAPKERPLILDLI